MKETIYYFPWIDVDTNEEVYNIFRQVNENNPYEGGIYLMTVNNQATAEAIVKLQREDQR